MQRALLPLLTLSLLAADVAPQTTTRISVDALGNQADGPSTSPALSYDGRFAAFESQAPNLVPGDTNNMRDIFVVELASGAIERVNLANSGAQANSLCTHPVLSGEGRFVAYHSSADSLVLGDTNGTSDVFLRDRWLGTTTLVSATPSGAAGNSLSSFASISLDGRYIAFSSLASDLVPGDTNGTTDVFVRDAVAGTTERVSVSSAGAQGDGYSTFPAISGDGRFVVFQSFASDLVAGDTNGESDVFVHDRQAGTTERVSVSSAGTQADGPSSNITISADGRFLAFQSAATNLVASDTNGTDDVFLRDRLAGATTLVSVSFGGGQGDQPCVTPVLSADGRCIAFVCLSEQLIAGDSNFARDVILQDLVSGDLENISVDSFGVQADDLSVAPALDASGTRVLFQSFAQNLVPNDTNLAHDVFLRLRGPFHPVSCAGDGSLPTSCPCGNTGAAGHGCASSAVAAGGVLEGEGGTNLDAVTLAAHELLPHALSIFLQGDNVAVMGLPFGDGLRCTAGVLRRLYTRNANGGIVSAPGPLDLGLRARAQALGDPLPPGSLRIYQVYYRDPSASFCPAPQGGTWNITNAVSVQW
ncbi:MAG: PD40 domain-containing protein [Planctomycetes bacterium]|nr:PD40 domain-containing protein [Planctomycetota bacterium]